MNYLLDSEAMGSNWIAGDTQEVGLSWQPLLGLKIPWIYELCFWKFASSHNKCNRQRNVLGMGNRQLWLASDAYHLMKSKTRWQILSKTSLIEIVQMFVVSLCCCISLFVHLPKDFLACRGDYVPYCTDGKKALFSCGWCRPYWLQ